MQEMYVPDQCRTCPRLALLAINYKGLEDQAEQFTEFAMGDAAPALLRQQIKEIDAGVPEDEIQEAIQGGFGQIRKQISTYLDQIDVNKDRVTNEMKNITMGCFGTLKMRAKAKSGETVTATVCTSQNFNRRDNSPDPAHVEYS